MGEAWVVAKSVINALLANARLRLFLLTVHDVGLDPPSAFDTPMQATRGMLPPSPVRETLSDRGC